MKIKYIALCLLLALVGCQRDEEMEIGQVSVSNERLEASYSSVEISCTFQTNVTIKNVKAYLSTTEEFSSATSYSLTEKAKNTFGANIEGLKDASTYYVRYEISNRWSSKMVDDVSEFNTIPYTTPTVQTNEVTDVTYNSAKVSGTIAANGGKEIKECGIVYSTNQNPTTANNKVTSGSGLGQFTCNLTDLQDGTTYYVRAYAINEKGTAYGEEVSFTTKQLFTPTIVTTQPTNVAYNSATVGGNVTSDGGAEVTERGIVYATTQNPTTADSKITNGSGLGEFMCNLTDLQDGTIYYVRAYAVNEKGIAYGNEVSFTTIAKTVATITTKSATNVSYTSATVGGNVTNDGGLEVTERGVVYSTNQNPTTADSKITNGSGLGEFMCNLTDLQDGTIYYVRAYAVNEKGTSYGEEVSFTTKAKTTATITTKSATNVSYTSAAVGGNVTSDGGAEVTERGIVYATTQNPTTADSKVSNGSGLGEFTCNLTDLQDGTIYYVRAYAVNEKGIAYGNEVSFTTIAKTVATITTKSATNVSYTSATVGGNVTNDGGLEVTERGVVYSTNQNPTTANNKVTSGSGLGQFTCNLTDLQDGTTYYARAYAINEKGTAYGEEVSFTTKQLFTPTIVTTQPTNVAYNSATVGGNVTNDGGAEITERGICYSTSTNPTIANTKISNGSGIGAFTCNLTDLQNETTYYVRAYAVNAKGTAYGEEVSFTTLKAPFENGHEYIDLGLSVKWATMNVGANSPEEHGDYFAWGETEPKETYDWSTYKWCNGSHYSLTKYNTDSSYGTVDNKTTLELNDDAARANWGGSWRMPTDAEMTELRTNCTWTWTTENGVNGYKVTSKSNGNSIFLPAAGYRGSGDLIDAGSYGGYWSSSLNSDYPIHAYVLFFGSGNVDRGSGNRYYGHSVRPVCP